MEAKVAKGSTTEPAQSGTVINDDPTETNNNSNSRPTGNLEEHQVFKKDADQYMPIASVTRIMRSILPPHAKIADDAKETIQACVSEFIGFVTTVANEKCHEECRKTITPQDVLAAMTDLGFDKYIEPLTSYFDQIHNQESGPNTKQQRYHARSETSFGQAKKQATIAHMPPTNYAPPHGKYNGVTGVRVSQMNNYCVHKPGGSHGEAVIAHTPPTNYAPPHGKYNGDTCVGVSQMTNYGVKKAGGSNGEGSSNKLVFDPYNYSLSNIKHNGRNNT